MDDVRLAVQLRMDRIVEDDVRRHGVRENVREEHRLRNFFDLAHQPSFLQNGARESDGRPGDPPDDSRHYNKAGGSSQ